MSYRVLIVDDSTAMRSFIRRTLQISGFEAGAYLQAADGVSALSLIEQEHVDIILTDINMPRMNGEQLVEQLAQSPTTRSIPVIVISTDATSVRIDHLRRLGARGYLVKPFSPEALRHKVEAVMGVLSCG